MFSAMPINLPADQYPRKSVITRECDMRHSQARVWACECLSKQCQHPLTTPATTPAPPPNTEASTSIPIKTASTPCPVSLTPLVPEHPLQSALNIGRLGLVSLSINKCPTQKLSNIKHLLLPTQENGDLQAIHHIIPPLQGALDVGRFVLVRVVPDVFQVRLHPTLQGKRVLAFAWDMRSLVASPGKSK